MFSTDTVSLSTLTAAVRSIHGTKTQADARATAEALLNSPAAYIDGDEFAAGDSWVASLIVMGCRPSLTTASVAGMLAKTSYSKVLGFAYAVHAQDVPFWTDENVVA